MRVESLGNEELRTILKILDHAIEDHRQWYEDMIRIFVCRMECENCDLSLDVYRHCKFGQWYYSLQKDGFGSLPHIEEIGAAHKVMHDQTRQVLTLINNGSVVSSEAYDKFSNALAAFRHEIYALKSQLELALYNHDELTMAITRSSMLPVLRAEQKLCLKSLQTSCLAMVDIDRFKDVNDKHGHLIGDKVLVIVAQHFMKNLRVNDKVFRYGGEEFLLYLQNISVDQAYKVVDGLRKNIDELPFNVGLPVPVHVSISCGLTILDKYAPVVKSIERADQAMYEAKARGRNQSCIWRDIITDK